MRTGNVVSLAPFGEDTLRFEERMEVVLVETFISEPAVETFDKRILHGLPRRDMVQLNAAIGRPSKHRERTHFRAVVENDRLGVAAEFGDDVERASHPLAGKAKIRFERKVLPRAIISDGENPKSAAVPKPIVDKVK